MSTSDVIDECSPLPSDVTGIDADHPAAFDEHRRYLESTVVSTIAGALGERRAWRSERLWPWWRFRHDQDGGTAWHEASHAVLAEGVFFVHRVSIVAGKLGNRPYSGIMVSSTSPDPASVELPTRVITDRRTIAKSCMKLGRDWRGGVREYHRLHLQAVMLLDANWPLVRAVARALSERRELNREEFLCVLESSRPTTS